MIYDDVERLRSMLACAHQPPKPGKLKTTLLKITAQLKKKKNVATGMVAKHWLKKDRKAA